MTSFADSKVTSRDPSVWILNEIEDKIRIPTQLWTTPKPSKEDVFERALDALLELTQLPYVGVFIMMILEMTYEDCTLLHAASCYSKKRGWKLFDLLFGDHALALSDLASTFEVYLYTIQETSIHMLTARKLWLHLFKHISASLQTKLIGDSAERTKLRQGGTNTPTTSDERLCGAYPRAVDECRLGYLIKNIQKVSSYTWKDLIQAMGPGDWKEVEKGYFALTGVAITDFELKEHSKRIEDRKFEFSFNHAFMAEVELGTQRKPCKFVFAYRASTIDKVYKSGSNAVPISSLGASPRIPINILASSHNPTSERARTYENSSLGATGGQIMEASNTPKRKRKRECDDPLQAGGCQVQSIIPTAKQTEATPSPMQTIAASCSHQFHRF